MRTLRVFLLILAIAASGCTRLHHDGLVAGIAFVAPHRLVTGSWDRSICLWDTSSHDRIATFRTKGRVTGLATSASHDRIVYTTDEHEIGTLSSDLNPLIERGVDQADYQSPAISPDDKRLAYCDASRVYVVNAFETHAAQTIWSLPDDGILFPVEYLQSLAWSPNSNLLCVTTSSGRIFVVDARSSKTLLSGIDPGRHALNAVVWPSENIIITGDGNGNIISWEPRNLRRRLIMNADHDILAVSRLKGDNEFVFVVNSPKNRLLFVRVNNEKGDRRDGPIIEGGLRTCVAENPWLSELAVGALDGAIDLVRVSNR